MISVARIRRATGVSAGVPCNAQGHAALPCQCARASAPAVPMRKNPSPIRENPSPIRESPSPVRSGLRACTARNFLRLRRATTGGFAVHMSPNPIREDPNPVRHAEWASSALPNVLWLCTPQNCLRLRRASAMHRRDMLAGPMHGAPHAQCTASCALTPNAQGPQSPVAQCAKPRSPGSPVRRSKKSPSGAHPRGASNSGN